ncbi:hypothetical protein RhiirA4_458086 [Rhizophagus irregularis]|uniref:Uncharacterized protein n=1 Tax=Rhizophagus irregularis TaxID=588596 RepID=A0A2I1GBE0_9GLOM|nr:hypothetical protein RhiirA4_458086 [Rhizophagus irregularis]
MASKLPSSCNVQYNSDNSQQTLETHIPSVRKKSGKDFELGKTLGEGSYSMTASLNTDFGKGDFLCLWIREIRSL